MSFFALLLLLFLWPLTAFGEVSGETEVIRDRLSARERLADAQWKSRVLLIFHGRQQQDWPEQRERYRKALKERDLVVIQGEEEMADAYGVSSSDFTLILIGKDGGVKAKQVRRVNLPQLFRLIDAMPMRRKEMEKRQQTPFPEEPKEPKEPKGPGEH